MIEFKRLTLPTFGGSINPMTLKHWITKMAKAFTYMKCPAEEKVGYAVYMLKDRAYGSWHSCSRRPWKMKFMRYHGLM